MDHLPLHDDDAFRHLADRLRTALSEEGLSITAEDEAAMRAEWRREPPRQGAMPPGPRLTLDDVPRVFDHIASGMAARRVALLREGIATVDGAPAELIAAGRDRVLAEVMALAARGEIVIGESPDGDPDETIINSFDAVIHR